MLSFLIRRILQTVPTVLAVVLVVFVLFSVVPGSIASSLSDGGGAPADPQVVERMNQLGMAIDVSHCGDRTTMDAIVASRRPVLVTHSNCRALVPAARCKTDEAIRAMAAKGGVMGITMVRGFVRAGGQPPSKMYWIISITWSHWQAWSTWVSAAMSTWMGETFILSENTILMGSTTPRRFST